MVGASEGQSPALSAASRVMNRLTWATTPSSLRALEPTRKGLEVPTSSLADLAAKTIGCVTRVPGAKAPLGKVQSPKMERAVLIPRGMFFKKVSLPWADCSPSSAGL